MRARLPQIVAAAASVLGLALSMGACGDEGSADLASLVPPDVPLYGESVLRPEGEQLEAIESLTEQVGGIDDPGARLVEMIDEALAEEPGGFTYADDVEPWLGERAAFFVRSFEADAMQPDAAALIEVTDAEEARDFIDRAAETDEEFPAEEREYEDHEYRADEEGTAVGLIDEVLVIGSEESFKVAADAAGGESLAESEDYESRIEPLDDDALATLYLEPAEAIEAAIASQEIDGAGSRLLEPLLAGPLSDPVTIGVSATEDSATLDAIATIDGEHPQADSALLEDLPEGAWLAATLPDLGPQLERSLDQLGTSGFAGADTIERRIRAATGIDLRRDVAGWLGDVAVFVRGTAVPGFAAGLVAQTSDPEGPRKLLEVVQKLAERDSGLRSAAPPAGADYGFSIGLPGVGAGAEVGVIGDRLLAAFGTSFERLLEPDRTLPEDERFQAAAERLGEDFPPAFFLDLREALAVAEQGADSASPDYDEARPFFEQLGSLVAGSRTEGDLLVSRLMVTLAE